MTEPSLKLPDDPDPALRRNPARQEPPTSLLGLVHLAIAVALVVAASFLGQIATMRGLTPWYASLVKPAFTPPNAVFPIAWSLLYALMAWAFWRILRLRPGVEGRQTAITLFCGQLALNALWSWAFFGFANPLAGLAVILALEVAILVTLLVFHRLDRWAGMLLWPYLAWVAYAGVLNGAIWWLNR